MRGVFLFYLLGHASLNSNPISAPTGNPLANTEFSGQGLPPGPSGPLL